MITLLRPWHNNSKKREIKSPKIYIRDSFEIKYTENPKITKSMNIALNDLELEHLYLIIPSNEKFKLSENITCLGIENLRFCKDF